MLIQNTINKCSIDKTLKYCSNYPSMKLLFVRTPHEVQRICTRTNPDTVFLKSGSYVWSILLNGWPKIYTAKYRESSKIREKEAVLSS